jgi:deoxycytidine triphosphate deaminase
MKLLYGKALRDAIGRNEVIANCEDIDHACLDSVRVGLSLKDALITDMRDIDMQNLCPHQFRTAKVSEITIEPGRFYIGTSRERIRIPSNMLGQMFTRSKYARVGLEFALSSSFVFPGYGLKEPMPFVFEISTRTSPMKLTSGVTYAFLVLYELAEGIPCKPDGDKQFPFIEGGLS